MSFQKVLIVKIILILTVECDESNLEKVCSGTYFGFKPKPNNTDLHYQIQIDQYTNCTFVDGNLEITWISKDLNHLQHIRQVSGYVMFHHVEVENVTLPNLQIIRGETLMIYDSRKLEYGLFVYSSTINSLQLPAIRAILNGSIYGLDTMECYLETANWNDIHRYILNTDPTKHFFNQFGDMCENCNSDCDKDCWAKGQQNCQSLELCSETCVTPGCFHQSSNDCCHPSCAGGCTGPTERDCFACRNYNDSGVCKTSCSTDQHSQQTVEDLRPNSGRNLAYGGQCVSRCPDQFKNDNGTCVRTCPRSKISKNGVCHACGEEEFCPKICIGLGNVNANNIKQYSGCNIIIGSLEISNETFDGKHKIHPDELKAFNKVNEVTVNINIQGHHAHFTNLSFFENLSLVGGSLYITESSLKSLELKSLKQIHGVVTIIGNDDLCYVGSVKWERLQVGTAISRISRNRNSDKCENDNYVCNKQCNEATGCLGAEADQCLECLYWTYKDTCVTDCSGLAEARIIFQNHTSRICGDCHPECKNSCTTSEADTCDACIHVKNGPICVSECPKEKYDENGICLPCHEVCDGCLGPNDSLSDNGCVSCHLAKELSPSKIQCLKKSDTCPVGFYSNTVEKSSADELLKPLIGRKICLRCHPSCFNCTGPGIDSFQCQQCANFKKDGVCVTSCDSNQYVDQDNECQNCSPECSTCDAAGEDHCIETMYVNPAYSKSMKIVVVAAIFIFCAMSVLILICCCKAKRAIIEKVQMSIDAGFEATVPLINTGVGPNLRTMRILKETEIRKGAVLGTGEFGQVFKGIWLPENGKYKIPIAIKSFRNMNDSESSKEFMAEAQIMASLEHPNILKLVAICVANEMMLITQFMPFGSLLVYVRQHRDKIDSKMMLNWTVQMAQGMAYLEGLRLVHRDLAARNVLVKTPTSIRIADFGMSKLLKHNTSVYESPGGKVAIKWLAPECIEHKTFTSKSDVWAFGVTVWEVLTYGTIPYTGTKPQDVFNLVVTGERLPKPDNCSVELYSLLVLCWTLDPKLRPDFNDFKLSLTEMASDPKRYLVTNKQNLTQLLELKKEEVNDFYESFAELDSSDAEIIEAEQYADQSDVEANPTVNADNYPADNFAESSCGNKSKPFEGYLTPNPPCIQTNGQGYLEMNDHYLKMEPGQGLYKRMMCLIRNFGNRNDNQNSFASVLFDPERNLEPTLTDEIDASKM